MIYIVSEYASQGEIFGNEKSLNVSLDILINFFLLFFRLYCKIW